ncbi:hypothetical protein BDR05DRAFT_866116, partial [Suillus weaverae]
INVDNQDLLSKMEGFAVQGVKRAAKNHQQCISDVRVSIHDIINHTLHKFFPLLCDITGDSGAKMQWAHYFHNIVQCYQVMVDGWPNNVPSANLSQVSSALPELERLLCKWESGTTHWKTLT